MSEQKERGDVEQALNELVEATRLGIHEGVKAATKRLDALGVPVKRRNGALRQLAAEGVESSDAEPDTDVKVEPPKVEPPKVAADPKTAPPVARKAPGASSVA